MRSSRFINVDSNILLEYIYNDDYLVSEPYNILTNSKTGIRSFTSFDDSETNNDIYNTIYKIDPVSERYSSIKLDPLVPNKIDSSLGFIQSRNFPSSIPIRYDTIKIHVPVNWTFDDYKGFHVRIYTFDYSGSNQVDLSNYYFDITDVEQHYKMEYSSPILIINEKQWGKFLKISIPSVTKVSDQRKNDITKPNSINFNLTDGVGLSKNSPIFIDFRYLESSYVSSGTKFYNLSPRTTMSFPQTPDFENLGVYIGESTQGDFFVVYGTYNGSLGELNQFLNESYYIGNRYYLEYVIDLYEKNVKVGSQTYVVNEEFNKPIEYRPILKFSTTTALVEVTLSLVDSVSGVRVSRKSSVGIIQEKVSKYSKSLSRIDIKKAKKKEVYNIKNIIESNVSNDAFGSKPILVLEKLPFTLFSSNFLLFTGSDNIFFEKKAWLGLNRTVVPIYPFDNILKFSILEKEGSSYYPYDLTTVRNLRFTIKSDLKEMNFDVYRDSDENDPELGHVVFRIPMSKYQEIKKANSDGVTAFYINAIDSSENRIIIYNGFFTPYDSSSNFRKINDAFRDSQIKTQPTESEDSKSNLDSKVKEVSEIQESDRKPVGIDSKSTLLYTPKPSDNSIKLNQQSDRTKPITPGSILTWILKKKSLSTLRDDKSNWIPESSAVVSQDLYFKSDGTTTDVKPTKETLDQYRIFKSKDGDSVKKEVFGTMPGINIDNWRKSEWPHFENIIYNATKTDQVESFKSRVSGGGFGVYETINDSGRVYYAEEIVE